MISEHELNTIKCNLCGHMTLYEALEAKRVYDDILNNENHNWKCELCYTEKGTVKVVSFYEECSECHQVFDPREPKCFCTDEKPQSSFKIVLDPKNQWRGGNDKLADQRRKEEIEMQKAESQVKQKIINHHIAKDVRDELNTNLLKKICSLLENQALPHENKRGHLDAIG